MRFAIKTAGLILVLLTTSSTFAANKFVPGAPEVKVHPKIDSIFSTLMQKHLQEPGNPGGFQGIAQRHGVKADGFRVEVEIFVRFPETTASVDRQILKSLDFHERLASENFIEGTIHIHKVFRLPKDIPQITQVRRLRRKTAKVTSEGVAITNAQAWLTNGHSGSGVKIAIIDFGFSGIASAVANGDFGSYTQIDYSGSGFPGSSNHGTSCAEVVYDFAPSATYYLIITHTLAQDQSAVSYCISNGIDIISYSAGYDNDNFCDGQGSVCAVANNANSNGILWVGAAGNEGNNQYWLGNWSDPDANNFMNFSSTDETQSISCTAGTTIDIILTWDNSISSSNDYDLYLYDSSLTTVVDLSQNVQTGTQQPYEWICYSVPTTGTYHIVIEKWLASGTSKFRLFSWEQLQYGGTATSLTTPGDASGSFTVGAIDQANWFSGITIESYSSRGPTTDSRIKPDICGPDGVSTLTDGVQGFWGTSASTPHVAGIAAQYLGQYPTSTPAQIRAQLETWAYDCGTTGKDSTYGAGEIELPNPPAADFSASPVNAEVGESISFTDASTGYISTYYWDFGDSSTSVSQNPTHSYSTSGTFTVQLTVSSSLGNDTETKTNYITVTPKADFIASPNSGAGEYTAFFTDTSQGSITSWSWNFGDAQSSSDQNPSHAYQSAGQFTVTLTISGPHGGDTEVKTSYITVTTPVPLFSASPSSGRGEFTTLFSDNSQGTIDTWLWDFGDGNTSDVQNPSHAYQSTGVFSVTLTVTGPFGSDSYQRTNYITVLPPYSDFTAYPYEGEEPLEVDFSQQTVGTVTSYSWDFGDGGTSNLEYPTHVYNTPGTYDVTLDIIGPYGTDSSTYVGYIVVTKKPEKEGGCSCSPDRHSTHPSSILGCILPMFFLAACICLYRRRSKRSGGYS